MADERPTATAPADSGTRVNDRAGAATSPVP